MTAWTPRHSPCVEVPKFATCHGLAAFDSRKLAHEARLSIPRRRGKVMVVYFCEGCGLYHIGRP